MNPKKILFIFSFLFVSVFGVERSAHANVFDEAFGFISNFSRGFGHAYPRRSYRRHSKRRRYRRRRHSSRRYRYRRARLAQRRRMIKRRRAHRRNVRRLARRRQIVQRRRSYALRKNRNQRRQALKMARVSARRSKQAQRQVKLAQVKLARARKLRAAQSRKSVRRFVKKPQRKRFTPVKIAKGLALPQRAARRPTFKRRQKVTPKPQLIEQARSQLAYGRRDRRISLKRSERKNVQLALSQAGFYGGSVDGVFGLRTRKAIRSYQNSLDQSKTGRLNHIQLASLLKAVKVPKQQVAGYLPQRDQKKQQREVIRKRAITLNNKLKAQAQVQAEAKRVADARKRRADVKSAAHGKSTRVTRDVSQKTAKVVAPQPQKKARAKVRKTRPSLFSKVVKAQAQLIPKKSTSLVHKASLQQKVTPQKVDYFHILTQTHRGENLWVVKCLEKKQLKLYYWREQKWWVRGAKGGAIGHSEYGQNGIQKLARKVCAI